MLLVREAAQVILRSALAAAIGLSGLAHAQLQPGKPVRLLTPYPPGGSTDTLSRVVAPKLSEILGASVNVEAMPGANGSVALSFLVKAAPDGHTILITTASPLVINPHTFPAVNYDALKDFTPITLVATSESAIVVHPSVPAKDLRELIELSRTRPIRFGVAGLGGQPEMVIEKIKLNTGARFDVVPYKGGGPAINDAVGGHVDAVLNDISGFIVPMVESGKLRGLSVLTTTPKSEFLPDSPTLAATGQPAFAMRSWLILLGPPNMPAALGEHLRKAVVEAVAKDDTIKSLRTNALLPYTLGSVEETRRFVAAEYEHFRVMQQQTGVKVR